MQPEKQEDDTEEEEEEMKVVPKTPLPVRQTRSSRNRKLAESVKKEEADLMKNEDKENEVTEEKTQPRTRSTRIREKSKENSSQVSDK